MKKLEEDLNQEDNFKLGRRIFIFPYLTGLVSAIGVGIASYYLGARESIGVLAAVGGVIGYVGGVAGMGLFLGRD